MTKEERAAKAVVHYVDVNKRLEVQTKEAIKNTKIYGPHWPAEEARDHGSTSVTLVDTDSVSCLFNTLNRGARTCILNYASYKNPGGMFLEGSPAQEEALCHESNLFPILLAFDGTYYQWNRSRLNKAIYLDRALYIPDVVFEHNGETRHADVLTCAAPNFRTAHRYQDVSREDNNAALRDRMEFIGKILKSNNVDNFITGAWGCGVFMQNPEVVATLSKEILPRYVENIYFAIPDRASSNYQTFERIAGGA